MQRLGGSKACQGTASARDVIAHGRLCAPWRQPGDKESVAGLLIFRGLTPLGAGFDSRRLHHSYLKLITYLR